MTLKRKTAISVFMVAFAFGLNITGIMPVLSLVSEQYKDYSTTLIQLLQTVPYGLLMAGSAMVGWMTTKWTKKKLQIFGLLVIGISGVMPFFTDSFTVLFLARILIGFGFGIVSPLNTAVIAEVYEPEERAGALGLHVVGMGLGAMSGNLLGAVLAGAGVRYFYLVYAIGFLSALIVAVSQKETSPTPAGKAADAKLNLDVYLISGMSFLHTLFINAYNTNISLYIADTITKDTGASGIATAVNSVFALLVGALFTKISGILKNATLPFSAFAAVAGYTALLFIPGMSGVIIASALCGVSLSCFMAMASYLLSVIVEKEAVAKASGVFSIVGGIGGLIAPVAMSGLSTAAGGNTPKHQFTVAAAGMLVLTVLIAIYVKKEWK